jgi:hypothetical protein
MTKVLPSAAPPNALKVWTQGRDLFVEVGGWVGRYPLHEGGLSKALTLIQSQRFDYSGPSQLARRFNLQEEVIEALLRSYGVKL